MGEYEDKEWLYEMYITRDMTQVEIGKISGVSHSTIYNYLKKNSRLLKGVGKYIRTKEIRGKNRTPLLGYKHSDSVNKSKGRMGHKAYKNQRIRATEIMTGANHWNWKGGVLSERRRLVNTATYKEFRTNMFARDNYTCQCCNTRGGEIQLHHIIQQCKREDLIMDATNVETLCIHCHINKHPDINCMKMRKI